MLENTQITSEPIRRIAVEPYPVNPFRWHAILETADFYQTAEIDTHTGSIDSDPRRDVLYKPTDTPAVEAAKATFLGHVYLDWGRWAVVRDIGQQPAATRAQSSVDHRGVHRPALCLLLSRRGPGLRSAPSQWLGLHRRRTR